MKRFSFLMFFFSFFCLTAFSQSSRTSNIQQNLGPVKPSMFGNSRPSGCDTFSNICADDTLVVYTATCSLGTIGGYVCGQNCYGDLSKVDIFHVAGQAGSTNITGVLFFFAVGQAANAIDALNVRIWDDNGQFADGGSGAPGTILATEALLYNTVKTDVTNGNMTYVPFSSPVAFPLDSSFYAGIDFTYEAGDTVSIINVLDRTASGLSCEDLYTAVDKFSDNTWHRFSDPDDWGISTSQMILPVLCSSSCAITITPSSAAVCKRESVDLSADGSPVLTWSPSSGLNTTTGNNVIAKPAVTTTYTVMGESCSATVTVVVNPTPKAKISVGPCVNGSVTLTRTGAPSTGVKFQWLKDDAVIPGATNSSYVATADGEYQVNVGDISTHCSHLSVGVNVAINCKVADGGSSFTANAYPNPFVKSITLDINTATAETANIKMMDFSGRIIHEYKNVDASLPFEINDDLVPGIYFINVQQGMNEQMIKVVKE
jgi:hypothetical protein